MGKVEPCFSVTRPLNVPIASEYISSAFPSLIAIFQGFKLTMPSLLNRICEVALESNTKVSRVILYFSRKMNHVCPSLLYAVGSSLYIKESHCLHQWQYKPYDDLYFLSYLLSSFCNNFLWCDLLYGTSHNEAFSFEDSGRKKVYLESSSYNC
jgi:hypothetical protein